MTELEHRADLSHVDEQPMVSVITIFLNAQSFIAEAIESVLVQSYPRWELLLVDDGSTDGSTAIARRFAELHPDRVRYLEHAGHVNRGMSASRNAGISAAHGSLIAFLDADDVWRPETLERQVATIMTQPRAGLVYGSTEIWHSWTDDPRDAGRDYARHLGVSTATLYEPPRLVAHFLAGEARPPATCSLLVRRAALDHVGGFEERFRGLHEDQVIFAKLCCAVPVYVSDECWGRYRQHSGSCCAEATARGAVGRQQDVFLSWLVDYVAERQFNDPEVRWLLGRKLWRFRHRTLGRLLDRALRRGRKATRLLYLLLGHGPWLAFEPELVPPRRVRRRDGAAVDEAWFRRAHEWGLLLRLYGEVSPTSHVLELDAGLGQIAYAMRYVLLADGSYNALGAHRDGSELLQRRYRYRYPNFRFDWVDVVEPRDNPRGRLGAAELRFPYPDAAFDLVFSALELWRLPSDGVANYLKESARVLRPGGRCMFSVLLLDQYRRGESRSGKLAAKIFEIDDHPTTDFVAVQRDDGERIIAYRQSVIEELAAAAGLELDRPPIAGSWSGTPSVWTEECDLVILRKVQTRPHGVKHVTAIGRNDTSLRTAQ
jgi:glycosyltransferase involved in cell wall biosynthesis